MPPPHQNWQFLAAGGFQDANASGTGSIVSRDMLDRLRMGQASIPSAMYPDGYLGTIRNRQEDRLLDSIKNRENQRAYQRGVHKGERIDPAQYAWPPGLDPMRGVRGQSRKSQKRQVPQYQLVDPPHLVNDGKAAGATANEPGVIDPFRSQSLQNLRPTWK